MADHEISKIMWISIVVALAASIYLISSNQINSFMTQIFDPSSGSISKVLNDSSNSDSKYTVLADHNLKYYTDADKILHVTSINDATPAIVDESDKSIFKQLNVQSVVFEKQTKFVGNLSGAFQLSTIKSIDFKNVDTSAVTNMDYMFAYTHISNLDVSNFNTSNVTSMKSMFSAASGFDSLDLSNFDTSKVSSMQSMFSGSDISTLNLSNFKFTSITGELGVDSIFASAKNLESVTLNNISKINSQYTIYDVEMSTMYSGSKVTLGTVKQMFAKVQ